MTEDRKEIKEGVKAKVIEILVEQITQENDFEKLKQELALELLGFKEEKADEKLASPTEEEAETKNLLPKREFNENDGLIPSDINEEMFKELNGFTYDSRPIEDRFKNGIDHLQARNGQFGSVSLLDHTEEIQKSLQDVPVINKQEVTSQISLLSKKSFSEGEMEALIKLNKLKVDLINSNPYKDNIEITKVEDKPTMVEPVESLITSGNSFHITNIAKEKLEEAPAQKPKRKPIKSNSQKSITKKKPAKRKG